MSQTQPFIAQSNHTSQQEANQSTYPSQFEGNKAEPSPPWIEAYASRSSGNSPLFVTFTGVAYRNERDVLMYEWDFEGDGISDYVSFNSGNTSHVYLVNTSTKYSARFTVSYKNGTEAYREVPILVDPVEWNEWRQIKDLGYVKYGFHVNGTIYIYDESNWIPLKFHKNGLPLQNPVYKEVNVTDGEHTQNNRISSRLTYDADSSSLDVTLLFGVTGKALFNFTEYNQDVGAEKVVLPNSVSSGKLFFKYEPMKEQVFLEGEIFMAGDGEEPVWGEGGAYYDPWKDQGLVPYGEYFENRQEYVSPQNGFLTIIETDLILPGRGLDLAIKRVYAPPSTYKNDEPAYSFDYGYQDYPWAPMGNGWQLGFPWIEEKDGEPSYIRLSNGQRYEYNGSGLEGTEYHFGDDFKLYNHSNGNYTLYTIDGTRYDFDDECRPIRITDTSGNNKITFSYENNKINNITDTIGRTVVFDYNEDGLVSSITSGSRIVNYSYTDGLVSGDRLVEVTDPAGRTTKYSYYKDYLIWGVLYPSGGHSRYYYKKYTARTYERYRVIEQLFSDGYIDQELNKTFNYDGDFDQIQKVIIRERSNGTDIMKTTKLFYYSNKYNEWLWDGEEDEPKIHIIVNYLDDNRRRIHIKKKPGDSLNFINHKYLRYDDWGNLVWSKDFEEHERFFSYTNTNSSNEYVDSSSVVEYFNDAFYNCSVDASIHNLMLGMAEFKNGTGTSTLETYYNYSYIGDLTETKQLLSGSWLLTKHTYDEYRNRVKTIDPNNHTTYFEYNSTYQNAYLTKVKRLLELENENEVNLTRSYCYDLSTGLLTCVVDERGNQTDYAYDILGRVTNVTFPAIDGKRAMKRAVYNDTNHYVPTDLPTVVKNSTTFVATRWESTSTFEAEGRSWVFYDDGSSLRYTSSSDGGFDWVYSEKVGYYDYDEFDVFFDGTYVHLAYSTGDEGADLLYRRGTPNSDGTVNWGNGNTVFNPGGGMRVNNPNIVVTDNYVWICFSVWNEAYDNDFYIRRSSDMTGGWTLDHSTMILEDENYSPYGKLAPLTDDKMYLAWMVDRGALSDLQGCLWNGSAWGSTETIDDTMENSPMQTFDVVTWDGDVWIFWTHDVDDVANVSKRTYSTSTWGDVTTLFNTPGTYLSVALSKGKSNGSLYAFWPKIDEPQGIYYKYYNGSSWDLYPTILHYENYADIYTSSLSTSLQPWEEKIAIVYTRENDSPYTLVHNYIWFGNSSDSTTTIYDENDNMIKCHYDGLARLKKIERYNGSISYSTEYYTYNWLGEIETWTTPSGSMYEYEYNALGRVTNVTNPDDTFRETVYDYTNNMQEVIDEEGRKRVLIYDWEGRLTDVKEYNSTDGFLHTEYKYDEVGNLVNITDSKGRSTIFQFDQMNRLVRIDYPDGTFEAKGYDAGGNLIWKRNQKGFNVSYQYDSLNRLCDINYPDGTNTTFGYDAVGNRIFSEWNETRIVWTYDARDRLLKERFNISGQVYDVEYGYDNASNVVSMTYPDDYELSIDYDALNRIASLGSVADFTYTVEDRVDTITYGNDVTTQYQYDSRSRPTNILVENGANVLMNLTYQYDGSGSVTQIYNGSSTETYGYDLLDRLNGTTGPWGDISYSYDEVGNRMQMVAGSTTSYQYDCMNRLTSATGMSFDWDPNGNMVYMHDGSDAWNYTYDPEDRLTTVRKNDVAQNRYDYDADGRRVGLWDSQDGYLAHVYSGLDVVCEVPPSGLGDCTKHFYANGLHVAEDGDGTWEYFHQDHLGSTRLKTDGDGSVVYGSNYVPFGSGYGEEGVEEFRYTGKQQDPSGLYYYGARYYDPEVGRFITEDPVTGSLEDPQSLNQYIYYMNNPLKYTDPDKPFLRFSTDTALTCKRLKEA